MTEKEMIEEMASFIIKTRNILKNILLAGSRPVKNTSRKDCYFCLMNLQELYKTNRSISNEDFLKILFEAKLPENSVVLTKEEYVENLYSQFKDGYKQARKETAKEILSMIDKIPTNEVNELNHLRLLKINIAKQFGVEVEE